MSRVKNIALSALLTIGAFSAVTYTSCKKDDSCPAYYTGSNCETEVRSTYAGGYKGTGTDDSTFSYTNFTFTFSNRGATVTDMNMEIKNTAGAVFLTLPVTLTSNNAFNINSTTVGSYTYSGAGTITTSTASVTINQTGASILNITFPSLTRI